MVERREWVEHQREWVEHHRGCQTTTRGGQNTTVGWVEYNQGVEMALYKGGGMGVEWGGGGRKAHGSYGHIGAALSAHFLW